MESGHSADARPLRASVLHIFPRDQNRSIVVSTPQLPVYFGKQCKLTLSELSGDVFYFETLVLRGDTSGRLQLEVESRQPIVLKLTSLHRPGTLVELHVLTRAEIAQLPAAVRNFAQSHPRDASLLLVGKVTLECKAERSMYNARLVVPWDPVQKIKGIGEHLSAHLARAGVETVVQLYDWRHNPVQLMDKLRETAGRRERLVTQQRLESLVRDAKQICEEFYIRQEQGPQSPVPQTPPTPPLVPHMPAVPPALHNFYPVPPLLHHPTVQDNANMEDEAPAPAPAAYRGYNPPLPPMLRQPDAMEDEPPVPPPQPQHRGFFPNLPALPALPPLLRRNQRPNSTQRDMPSPGSSNSSSNSSDGLPEQLRALSWRQQQ